MGAAGDRRTSRGGNGAWLPKAELTSTDLPTLSKLRVDTDSRRTHTDSLAADTPVRKAVVPT